MSGIKPTAQVEGSGSRLVGSWPNTGMSAAQFRWGQNEASVYKSLQRENGDPMGTSWQTLLEGLFSKLGPYTITEAEPELRHPISQLGSRKGVLRTLEALKEHVLAQS